MPRRANAEPSVSRHVNIRQTISARVDLLLMDPVKGRPRYGAFSSLVEQLLSKHLQEQENAGSGNPTST